MIHSKNAKRTGNTRISLLTIQITVTGGHILEIVKYSLTKHFVLVLWVYEQKIQETIWKGKIKKGVVLDKNETNIPSGIPINYTGSMISVETHPTTGVPTRKSRTPIEGFSNISVDIWKSESNWDGNSKMAKHNTRFPFLSILP